jgi:hypothetical protein
MSFTTIRSAISQPRPALKPYHQLVHGLNSLLLWFQRRVWLADGAVCDNITPCPIGSKKGWIGGGYFHLFQAPFGAALEKKALPVCTVLVWCCGGCSTGTILVAAFAAVAKMSV